jgi:hypothetical protein
MVCNDSGMEMNVEQAVVEKLCGGTQGLSGQPEQWPTLDGP